MYTHVLFTLEMFAINKSYFVPHYRGITLLSVVGKVSCKVLNTRLVQHFDKGGMHEGQTGFRLKRSCVDNIYTLNELVQGRMKESKSMFAFL